MFNFLLKLLKLGYDDDKIKGDEGEAFVNKMLRKKLNEDYFLLENVVLQTENDTTQIDHIVVSKYGVFVIETKNMAGWIFGSANQKQWTQCLYGRKYRFQNPIHQNFKHIKAVQRCTGLSSRQIITAIVFVGEAIFKTELPACITYRTQLIDFINSMRTPLIPDLAISKILDKINSEKLKPRNHRLTCR